MVTVCRPTTWRKCSGALYSAPTFYLWVSYDAGNKEPLLPYKYQPSKAHWLLRNMHHQVQHSDALLSIYKICLYFHDSHKKIAIFLLLFFSSCSASFLILFLVSLAPRRLTSLYFYNWRESTFSLRQELNFWVTFKRETYFTFLIVFFVFFYFKTHHISSAYIVQVSLRVVNVCNHILFRWNGGVKH